MCENKKRGISLSDGKKHQADHRAWSRRTFLRHVGLAGGVSMVLGNLPVLANSSSPLGIALNNSTGDRILVLIRLKGGNDGLNTIVPVFDYDTYRQKRSTLAFEMNELTRLNDDFSIPKSLDPIYPMWDEGRMKVIHNVGYPDQNLSHFRSTDIWASASDANEFDTSGWLGRYILNEFPDLTGNPPEVPPAIQIGGVGNSVFNDLDMTNTSFAVTEPRELAELAERGQLFDTAALPDCFYGEQVGFMRTMTNNTVRYAGVIAEAYDKSTTQANYQMGLGEQLAVVARLIKGGLGTRLYMVTIDGFDTHANQIDDHPALMRDLSSAIQNFYADLKAGGRDEDVLSMTFSEFGRRIEQNASDGTDHGAAAPLMLFGAALNGNGFLGNKPDMTDVDEDGNLKYDFDFRQVYATVLQDWLCVEPEIVDGIMGDRFTRLDVGLSCSPTTSVHTARLPALKHQARYHNNGQVTIVYEIPTEAAVRIDVFDALGQPVSNLVNARLAAGEHQARFSPPVRQLLSAGVYVYRIQAGGQMVSGKVRLVRN